MNKNNYGYTFIEMLLVLFMAILLVGFPILKLKKWEERYRVHSFLSQLEKDIIRVQHSALFSGDRGTIAIYKDNKFVEISYTDVKQKIVKKLLEVPKGITTTSTINLTFNGTSGNNQKIEKFKLLDEVNGREITYQFQLGSGKYVKYVKK